MISSKKFKLSQNANKIISDELKKRIPFFREIRIDSSSEYVSQADMYGNIDSVISIGGTRIYNNQNKSRNDLRKDLCIECRSSRSMTINPETGKIIPIAGAYWYDTGQCWLSPRWGETDLLTIFLPGASFVGHYNRYYLDILFSSKSTWETMTGIHKMSNDSDTYIVFFDYQKFSYLYLQTVAKVTCGNDMDIIIPNKLIFTHKHSQSKKKP